MVESSTAAPTPDAPVGSLPGEMKPDPDEIVLDGTSETGLGTLLRAEFEHAEGQRRYQEELWLKDLRQYKGVYDPEIMAKIHPNRSKAFIRLTRVKVRSTDARMGDMLFPAGDRNWDLDKPSFDDLDPGKHTIALAQAFMKRGLTPEQGAAMDPEQAKKAISEVAEEARNAMVDEMRDQLKRGGYESISRDVMHSGHLYGTGILKGPLSNRRMRKAWKQTQVGNELVYGLVESEERYPFFEPRPVWNIYPDPYAITIADCDYLWDSNTMTRGDLRKLSVRNGFDKDVITKYLADHPEGDSKMRWWEVELQSLGERWALGQLRNRFELLERWGMLTGNQLRAAGLTDKIRLEQSEDEFSCTVWMLGNHVVRAVLEPLMRGINPYKFYYFENDESSIWGTSLCYVYRDTQASFNSAFRVTLDNAAIAGGPQVEVNRDLLDDEDDVEDIFPFRVWVRTGMGPEAMAPAVRVYPIQSYVSENMQMASMIKQLGDEVTVAQSYTYGEAGKNAANTVGGLSMLMGQSNISMKDQAKMWDDGITVPFMQDLFDWNMVPKNNPRDDIKGDFQIVARGSSALVAKEVRSRSLAMFRTSTANPIDGPFTSRRYLLREEAKALDLNADAAVPDELDIEDMPPAPPAMPGMMPGAAPGPMGPMAGPGGPVGPGNQPVGNQPPPGAQQVAAVQ